jgi:hypothetical protein
MGEFTMRTLRLTLVAPVILALLAGLGATVVAQETSDEMVPASATGTLEFLEPTVEGETGDGDEAFMHEAEATHVHAWNASDPRLTGNATYTGTWHLYDPPSEDCGDPEAQDKPALYEIVNDGGGWRCAGARAPVPGPDGATNVHTLVFRGTGGYEGLSAYILVDWSASPYTFGALITPNDLPLVPVPQG